MKRLSISVLTLSVAMALSAQAALDLQSRATLRQLRAQQPEVCAVQGRKAAPLQATSMTPVMMIVDPAVSNEQLEAEGIVVNARRENFVFAAVAIDDVERVAGLRGIRQMQLPRDVHQKLDQVRTAIGVDKIHAGTDLPKAYTGEGVVTGIVDGGIDPNNINFLREDGTNRVEYLTHIYYNQNSQSGYSMNEYNSATVSKFKTDDATAYHGTHTLGIMAGGYKGKITMATQGSMMGGDIIEAESNPYYGMAYNSDIVASCGTLQDYFIALGIESTLEYAYYMQKPAVVNLSLGSNTGPHDGTGILSQYMAMAGQEAILCVAAGNEGDLPIALNKTLTETDQTVQTFIRPQQATYQTSEATYRNLRYGQIYVYSNDTTPFDIKAVIYNKSRQVLTFQDAAIRSSQRGQSVYYATSGYEQSDSDKSNTNFAKAFNGYLGVGADLDTTSHRYYAMIDYFVHDNTKTNANGDYILGFVVTGKKAGQRIDCFCDGTWTVFDDYAQAGWQTGSQNGSISDMACGDGILVVGSYNNRLFYTSLDGKTYSYGTAFAEGEVSPFSSWGTTINGDNLPHVVAPGVTVISSISEPYTSSTNFASFLNYQQAKVENNGKTYYWEEAIGTSMATPVVTGAIALWLEANPRLTIEDVKDIVAKTAKKDNYMLNSKADPIQWGAGKFDAYEGLKEAIRRATSIDGVESNSRLLVQTADNRHFNLFLGGAQSLDVLLYNIAGQIVGQYAAAGDEINIDASALAAGVYVLQANGHTEKIIVK